MTRTLDAAAYWKLRAICAESQRCAAVAVAAREAMVAADKKQTALLVELGLDPKAPTFTLDDDTFTVTVPDAP